MRNQCFGSQQYLLHDPVNDETAEFQFVAVEHRGAQ